jgi:outer membrane lipoprotein carrier protein
MIKFRLLLGLLLTVSWMGLGLAQTPAAILQEKLAAIRSMHAQFSQTVQAKQRTLTHTSGSMALNKPNRFRWETKRPMAQIVVADGKKVWVYDVELEQVTVSKQTADLGAAGALFLSQHAGVIDKKFTVSVRSQNEKDIFDLHAKSAQSNFEHVRLIFTKNKLSMIHLDDQLGQHTTIHFSKVTTNQPEPLRLFQFHVPAGVDVVHQ